jgi:uncharacterized protein (TIGR03437 family)
MNLHSCVSAILFLGASAALAQPVLAPGNPVVNGASYADQIAPGSIFLVFGTNLASSTPVQARLPLQPTLGGVSIRFTPSGGGPAVDALVLFTRNDVLQGLLPSSAAPGNYSVTVTYNNQTSAPGIARVVARRVGIVSADSSGAGQAQAQIFYSATSYSLNRFTSGKIGTFDTAVAHPGEAMVLWATGVGADPSSDGTGGTSGDRTSAASIRIRLGAKEITPGYAGRASGLPGTDQINFTVPADVETGCTVPLQVMTGDVASNAVTLAIAPSSQSACTHPFLSNDQLRRMSEGGTLTFGSLSLSRSNISSTVPGLGSFEFTSESAGGLFARYGVGNLGEYQGDFSSVINSCRVIRFRSEDLPTGEYQPPVLLDAGSALRLNGPGASNVSVPKLIGSHSYSNTLYSSGFPGVPGSQTGTPTIAAGSYTMTGPGGADVGPFVASVNVPAPLNWTNRDSTNEVNRGQTLNLTWSGGGNDVVSILGASYVIAGGTVEDPIYEGATFICFQNASAGGFGVPSSILSQLPPSSNVGDIPGGILLLQLVGPANGGRFTAPLTAGGTVDYATFTYGYGFSKTVGYR